jgi:nicotinate-nucleotide adenylyltransferase
MKIGIFGGTFDPPHIGHLILAEESLEQLSLSKILWVLTPYPPHKVNIEVSPVEDRMNMVLLAIAENTKFSLSRVDIDRPAPHYASATMEILAEKHPKDELIYLMGADSLNELKTWHEPMRFISLCHEIGVMRRHGEKYILESLEQAYPGIKEKLHFIKTPIIEVSGSDIRERAVHGRGFRYFVPDTIFHYIVNHKLYLA